MGLEGFEPMSADESDYPTRITGPAANGPSDPAAESRDARDDGVASARTIVTRQKPLSPPPDGSDGGFLIAGGR